MMKNFQRSNFQEQLILLFFSISNFGNLRRLQNFYKMNFW
jgi:hypothetical protein